MEAVLEDTGMLANFSKAVLEDTGMLANFWKAVLEDTGMLANFSKLKSNTNYADNEITKIWKTSFICT